MKFRIFGLPAIVAFVVSVFFASASAQAQFSQQTKLVGTGVSGKSAQGSSVSLSADGNTAIVGGGGDDNGLGATWVFTRSNGVWAQQGPKLVGTGVIGVGAWQGVGVSLSRDGSTAIVGGPLDDNTVGAAWVYTQPEFAGIPGQPNCVGVSVTALIQQYGSLARAAAALHYSSVAVLQSDIAKFYAG